MESLFLIYDGDGAGLGRRRRLRVHDKVAFLPFFFLSAFQRYGWWRRRRRDGKRERETEKEEPRMDDGE